MGLFVVLCIRSGSGVKTDSTEALSKTSEATDSRSVECETHLNEVSHWPLWREPLARSLAREPCASCNAQQASALPASFRMRFLSGSSLIQLNERESTGDTITFSLHLRLPLERHS